VPVCNSFFNGEPENRELLNRSYQDHPGVQFVEFAYDEEPYGSYSPLTSQDEDWSHYWHSTARYVGFHFVEDVDYVFFLDVDEIVEASRFIEWLQNFPVENFSALRLESYFYFGSAENRAIDCFPLNGLLVRKEALVSHEMILDVFERKGLYDQIEGPKQSHVRGLDGKPLVHHYSWVRTEEELKKKIATWGHRHDRDWEALLSTDRLYRFQYEQVKPFCNPFEEKSINENICAMRVEQVDRKRLWLYNTSL
jgi:hypothetical protein